MLHNTGQYEPNETPVNRAAPLNMTPGSHMNIVSNINQLAKLGHGSTPTPSGPYGLGDYAVYHHQNFNMPSQIAQFPNHQYQHLGVPHNYSNHNPSSANEGSFQNGMMPMNLNIHNEHSANMFSYENKSIESVRPNVIKDQNIKKIALNIPQIPNKVLPKQPLFENDYLNNDPHPFHNPNHNLDLSMKANPERIEISSSRRKKIENTVKLIENILINSSNTKPKPVVQESINDTLKEMDCSSNLSEASTNAVRTESHAAKNDALSSTLVDSGQDSNLERESTMKSPATNDDDDVKKSEMDVQSDTEDVKPINITLGIDPQNLTVTTEKCIEIKIENASWTDTDYVQPFFRDSHSLQREQVVDLRIIDSDTSVAEALAAIQNIEVKSEACYECPHCCVLFTNPKRFLIHTKWHTFGLTNEKRTELLREREEKKNQRKEAKIIERMNAKEITDTKKVEGKTWPCKDCDKIFSAKGSLKNHRQRSHPTRLRECRVCHKTVVGWLSLRNHMATHAIETGGFQCSECPKRFKYSHSLTKHSDTHLEKVHGCAHCPKKFGSQALLKMHMKTHERHLKGATFRCTYCAKGFFESYSLQVHERTHRNERPYLCEICNTSYGTNSSLKRHLKVSHSTSKPFECSICHRSFSTEPIRDRHEERVHSKPEDFKFPCKQCDCKYLKQKDLKKHISKAHPKNKRRKRAKSESEPEEDSE